MWKIAVGFILFAALALYILNKSGADVDMGGEKHSVEAPHSAEPAKASASMAAPAAIPAAATAASSAASSASAAN